jgi:hypothetical protein
MNCLSCHSKFEEDLNFYSGFGIFSPQGLVAVPPPRFCFHCRLRRKLAWRNLRFLYRVPSAFSNKPIISAYGPHVNLRVVSHEEWFSEDWDPFSYGQAYRDEIPFLEQMNRLFSEVPWRALTHYGENINSDYCISNFGFKNCYLTFWGDCCEDCVNCFQVVYLKDCVDCVQTAYSELCYHCVGSHHLYNDVGAYYSSSIHDSAFVFDCRDCSNCFLCVGLANKRYCIRNDQFSKEEYEKKVSLWNLRDPQVFDACLRELEKLSKLYPVRGVRNVKCEDVVGNDLTETARMKDCFFCFGPMSDCSYIVDAGVNIYNSSDLHGCAFDVKHCLDSFTLLRCQDVGFSINVEDSIDVFYSAHCFHCEHVFGCYGLKRARYCILNRQYSAGDYWKLLSLIIAGMTARGEWGEFFHGSMSPFGYDETLAQDCFPIDKAEAESQGLLWCGVREKFNEGDKKQAYAEAEESAGVAICEKTGRPFRVAVLEKTNREKLGVPPPDCCPEVRLSLLLERGSEPRLYHASCCSCSISCLSGFALDSAYKVLCEHCALARV